MFKKLEELFSEQEAAEKATSEEIRKIYPIGTVVNFQRGRGDVTAEVKDLQSRGGEHRMRVENIHTGKLYWITIYPDHFPEIA